MSLSSSFPLLNLPGYSGMRHFITSLPRTHSPLAFFFFFLTKKKNIRRNTAKPSISLFFTAQEGEDLLEVTWWISNEARLPIHPPPRQHSFFYIPLKKKKGVLWWKVFSDYWRKTEPVYFHIEGRVFLSP